jgi:hypothetical protein
MNPDLGELNVIRCIVLADPATPSQLSGLEVKNGCTHFGKRTPRKCDVANQLSRVAFMLSFFSRLLKFFISNQLVRQKRTFLGQKYLEIYLLGGRLRHFNLFDHLIRVLPDFT